MASACSDRLDRMERKPPMNKQRGGRRRLGIAIVAFGMLVTVASVASCASDTQPYPPGFFGFIAPKSWQLPLLLVCLAGMLAAVGGLLLLLSHRDGDRP